MGEAKAVVLISETEIVRLSAAAQAAKAERRDPSGQKFSPWGVVQVDPEYKKWAQGLAQHRFGRRFGFPVDALNATAKVLRQLDKARGKPTEASVKIMERAKRRYPGLSTSLADAAALLRSPVNMAPDTEPRSRPPLVPKYYYRGSLEEGAGEKSLSGMILVPAWANAFPNRGSAPSDTNKVPRTDGLGEPAPGTAASDAPSRPFNQRGPDSPSSGR